VTGEILFMYNNMTYLHRITMSADIFNGYIQWKCLVMEYRVRSPKLATRTL